MMPYILILLGFVTVPAAISDGDVPALLIAGMVAAVALLKGDS